MEKTTSLAGNNISTSLSLVHSCHCSQPASVITHIPNYPVEMCLLASYVQIMLSHASLLPHIQWQQKHDFRDLPSLLVIPKIVEL